MQPIYLFHRDITPLGDLRRDHPDLKAVWYDGASKIIRGLVEQSNPSRLFIEETIFQSVSEVLGLEREMASSLQFIPVRSLDSARRAQDTVRVCIFPSNDTHAFLFEPVVQHLSDVAVQVAALKDEGAENSLERMGIPFSKLELGEKGIRQFDVLLSANDWGPVELYAHKAYQKFGKRTACLQESVIRFDDPLHRMEWANFPLLQGLPYIEQLPREVIFLAGNPRYEALSPSDLPTQNRVLINSNFTYGIFETIRSAWIEDAVSACTGASLDYLIAQHPRDQGALDHYNVIPSNAAVIHQLIRESTIVVSRFSSLIHEALALGRPVVYFNPHGEEMDSSISLDGTHIVLARDKKELRQALSQLTEGISGSPAKDEFFENYSMAYFGSGDGRASSRVAQALEVIAGLQYVPPGRVISPLKIKYRLAKLRVRKAITNKIM
jgi:hypothetical protein